MSRSTGWNFLLRLKILVALFIIAAGLLISQSFKVQIFKDERLEKLAARQYLSQMLLSPRRGLILDRNGEAMAVNIEGKSLAANPKKVKLNAEQMTSLAAALRVSKQSLQKKLKSSRSFVWLSRHLSDEALDSLKKRRILDGAMRLPSGLWLVNESKRAYPHGHTADSVLGSVNIDADGIEGIELQYDEWLSGQQLQTQSGRDALGRRTYLDPEAMTGLKDGQSLKLSLDLSLQFQVEDLIRKAVSKSRARTGIALVMNAENGEILALVNEQGADDAEKFSKRTWRRNRAYTDTFEPGSTVKPLLMAGALSQGWKSDKKLYGENGSFKLAGRTISEAESHEKFKWITLHEMVTRSSNIVAAKLALTLGPDKTVEVLKKFGLGAKLHTGFPGESSGLLLSARKIAPITLANMGFGQGLTSTPLQIAAAYAVLANGGHRVQPKLTLSKKSEDSSKKYKILSGKVITEVEKALAAVVKEGSGKAADIEGYQILGKTGTAQLVDEKTKAYSREHYYASFVGYARDIHPKWVIYVGIERPRGQYYGAQVAAPVFADIFRTVVRRFAIPPRLNPALAKKTVKESESKDMIQLQQSSPVVLTGPIQNLMPNVQGLPLRDALKIINHSLRQSLQTAEMSNLRFKVKGQGSVQSQSPAAGAVLKNLKTVELKLSNR